MLAGTRNNLTDTRNILVKYFSFYLCNYCEQRKCLSPERTCALNKKQHKSQSKHRLLMSDVISSFEEQRVGSSKDSFSICFLKWQKSITPWSLRLKLRKQQKYNNHTDGIFWDDKLRSKTILNARRLLYAIIMHKKSIQVHLSRIKKRRENNRG